jgi:hypothetical protein
MQGDADVPGNADIPDKTDIPDGTGMQDNAGSADNPAGPEVPADPEGSKDAEQGADMPGGTGGAETPGDPKDPETPADPKDSVTPADPETPTGPEDPKEEYQDTDAANAVDRLRNALLDNKTPAVTGELIRLFFEYQGEHHGYKGPRHQYELRLLPEFGPGKTLDWDGLTVFVYHMANYFVHDEEWNYYFSEELFDETARRLLPDLEYKHRSSGYFGYNKEKGLYISAGWDMHGYNRYRLKSISGDGEGTFTASFDGFHFYETDYFGEPYNSVGKNMKALYDYVGDRNAEADTIEVLLEVFLRDNYDKILHVNEHLEITFRISSDPEFAFEYLSCERDYMDQ